LVLHRHDLTDEEWARLEPLLPGQTHTPGARHEPPADIPAEVVATTELDTRGRVE